ncbi:MAG TPA: hypothetical protein VMR52_11795 [Dehalococcoidia bacterium]|nr:hypothetical protein [Dehalococcoidia bacterium]
MPALWERLEAGKSIRAAFGDPLYFAWRGNPAFPPSRGNRSLATIRAKSVRAYRVNGKIRADFEDGEGKWTMVPVEDLRLWHQARGCDECRGDAFDRRLESEVTGKGALLRIGLGRPFRPDGQQRGCFLQINSVVWPNRKGLHLHGEVASAIGMFPEPERIAVR